MTPTLNFFLINQLFSYFILNLDFWNIQILSLQGLRQDKSLLPMCVQI